MISLKEVVKSKEQGYSFVEERVTEDLEKLNIEYERQYPIGKFSADFYFPKTKTVLEIDGADYHFANNEQFERDRKRDDFMVEKGYTVVRVTGKYVMKNPHSVIAVCNRELPLGAYFISLDTDIANCMKYQLEHGLEKS